jgi:hypothetical protein
MADLALILFVTAMGGLVAMPLAKNSAQDTAEPQPSVAPSQALFRSSPNGPTLTQWLESQPRDPRATLSIFVEYTKEETAAQLAQAAAMIEQAEAAGVLTRVIVRSADRKDIYASLAYDEAR